MIESLTPGQVARLDEFRSKWIAIGLSTEPADRSRAEAAIRAMYLQAKLTVPRIVWCGSPLGNALARLLTEAVVKRLPGDSVWASVRYSVWDSVGDSVWASVRYSVWDSVGDSVWASVYGQHDSPWLSFYDFFGEACGLRREVKPLAGLVELAKSAGWALTHANYCWVSERPCELHRDTNGRLHRDGGAALLYPDGWGIYAWHGVRLPEEWGAKPSREWSPDWLLTSENAEHRRVLIEGLGYERISRALGATTVHKQADMELMRIAKEVDVEPIVLLRVTCPSTGHIHTLRVPPGMTDCETARRWTFSDEPLELLAET